MSFCKSQAVDKQMIVFLKLFKFKFKLEIFQIYNPKVDLSLSKAILLVKTLLQRIKIFTQILGLVKGSQIVFSIGNF
jgi:hypothetical protein